MSGAEAPELAERLSGWLEGGSHRTHDVEGDRHVLRERGTLVATNADLGRSLDIADRKVQDRRRNWCRGGEERRRIEKMGQWWLAIEGAREVQRSHHLGLLLDLLEGR